MEWEFEKERLGKSIVRDLYEHEFIKTIYSNEDNVEGWTLKSGIWSPVYINLRPVGSVSEIFEEISYGLDRLIHYEAPKTTILVGIEMAGIPLAVGASLELRHTLPTRGFPFAYTRSLPGKKVRTVEEAKTALAQLDRVHDYGGHSLVEGHFENGDVICLVDDMTTNIESKLISREIIKHELKSRGIEEYSCNDVAVLL
ncbi:hypothetical protein HN814_04035, partial [Candidatus Woesearchaeota archaeon]|nr:hypothetical protein [Candidatus Woesearchaeota archaeon]